MAGVIDLHSHILPGIDDGCNSLDDAVAMARAAVDDGVDTIAATPHVRDDYPTSAERIEELLLKTRAAVAAEGLPLRVLAGVEIALDRLSLLDDHELRRLALGGARALLLEFPYAGWPLGIEDTLFRLRARGFRPVLAHAERNADVQSSPRVLGPLVEGGGLVQVTAASLLGHFGRSTRSAAFELVDLGLAYLIASDAHSQSTREIAIGAAARAIGADELATWLTHDVPRALVEDEAVPSRPPRKRRRRFHLLRG